MSKSNRIYLSNNRDQFSRGVVTTVAGGSVRLFKWCSVSGATCPPAWTMITIVTIVCTCVCGLVVMGAWETQGRAHICSIQHTGWLLVFTFKSSCVWINPQSIPFIKSGLFTIRSTDWSYTVSGNH